MPRSTPAKPFWWLRYVAALAAGGFVAGFFLAVVNGSTEPYFVTDTVSYVPAEAWWAHGLMMGTTFALVGGAFLFSLWLIGVLIRRQLFFLLVGLMMASMGALMIWLAVTGPDGIDKGLRVLFGAFLGPASAFFGLWGIYRGVRTRRNQDAG